MLFPPGGYFHEDQFSPANLTDEKYKMLYRPSLNCILDNCIKLANCFKLQNPIPPIQNTYFMFTLIIMLTVIFVLCVQSS